MWRWVKYNDSPRLIDNSVLKQISLKYRCTFLCIATCTYIGCASPGVVDGATLVYWFALASHQMTSGELCHLLPTSCCVGKKFPQKLIDIVFSRWYSNMLWSGFFLNWKHQFLPPKKDCQHLWPRWADFAPCFCHIPHFPSNFSRLTQEARLREAVLTEAALVSELFLGGVGCQGLLNKYSFRGVLNVTSPFLASPLRGSK